MINDAERLDNPNTDDANAEDVAAVASAEHDDETVAGKSGAPDAVTARREAGTQQARAEKFPAGRVL